MNQSNPTSGYVLSWNGSDYAWTAQTGVTYDLTASVGSVEINSSPIIIPTGQSATLSVGSITPADVMGLTGQSATASVAAFGTATGFGIQAYSNVDTGSNSSYTNVATGSNTSYSDVATGSNTSYSDAA